MFLPRNNKYHNRKVIVDGDTFDSQKEYRRFRELKLLERTGEITGLKRQVKYVLIRSQRDEYGKVIERECSYYADFVYRDKQGRTHVEDVKGVETEAFKIKKKLMLERYGIRIALIR